VTLRTVRGTVVDSSNGQSATGQRGSTVMLVPRGPSITGI